MKNEDNYDILYDRSIQKLKARVEDKKLRGWRCLGSVVIENQKDTTMFYQAMEKKEEVL